MLASQTAVNMFKSDVMVVTYVNLILSRQVYCRYGTLVKEKEKVTET